MSDEIQKYQGHGSVQKNSIKKLDLSSININALEQSLNGLTLPRLFYQLVVFVLDGSGSMTFPGITGQSKGEEVEKATKEVIQRLLESKNKSSFEITLFAYANESVEILPITSVCDIDLSRSINPCDFIKRYDKTDLEETLSKVTEVSTNYLKHYNDKNAQVLILILSDGALHNYEKTLQLCNLLKVNNRITMHSNLFESKDWIEKYNSDELLYLKENLKKLASGPDYFMSTPDPDQVRKHMIKSISTVSKLN
jgi:hypothetical protein